MQPATNPLPQEINQSGYRPLVLIVAILMLLQTLFAVGVSFVFYIFSFGNIVIMLIGLAILAAMAISAIASIQLIRKKVSSPQVVFPGFCNLSFTFLVSISLSNMQGMLILLFVAVVIYIVSAIILLAMSKHSPSSPHNAPEEASQPQVIQQLDDSTNPVQYSQSESIIKRKRGFILLSRSTATTLMCMPLILPLGTIFLVAITNSFLPISRELGTQIMQATISISMFLGMVSFVLGVWIHLSIHRKNK